MDVVVLLSQADSHVETNCFAHHSVSITLLHEEAMHLQEIAAPELLKKRC